MKNNKTPDIHNMASGVVIFRGEESVKQITKIVIQVLETKTSSK